VPEKCDHKQAVRLELQSIAQDPKNGQSKGKLGLLNGVAENPLSAGTA
jgi:hypothetical protein